MQVFNCFYKLSETNSVHSAKSLLFLLYKDLQGVYIRERTSSSSHLYTVLPPFRTSCCNQEIHYHTVEGLGPACRVKVDAQTCSGLEADFENNVLTVSIIQLVIKSSDPKKYHSVPEIVGRHETKSLSLHSREQVDELIVIGAKRDIRYIQSTPSDTIAGLSKVHAIGH